VSGVPAPATSDSAIETAVAGYYSRTLERHGVTHRGVDWSSRASQELRFATLLDGIDWSDCPTLLDYGCGFGALAHYIDALGVACDYVGYDLAPAMIDAALRSHGEHDDRRFTSDPDALRPADHVIASGIFNVRLDIPRAAWTHHVGATIERLGSLARRRLAFNLMPAASAPELEREDLYYANPGAVVRYCRAVIGGDVQLREHYGLWEFTVVVSREDGGR
jgi:SAM-dependent methyltransferase